MATIDLRSEIREFLSSRRARITPEQAGLPAYGGNRRVTGLRREEVALLAGGLRRLLRSNGTRQPGRRLDSVLDALAGALHLDEAERDHLFALARQSHAGAGRRSARTPTSPVEAGRNPNDQALIALVGELSTHSDLFRQRWASQDVRFHRSGRKRIHHLVVGQLELDFEALELPSEPGLQLNVYTAAAGTPTTDGQTPRQMGRQPRPSRHRRTSLDHSAAITTDPRHASTRRGPRSSRCRNATLR